LREIYKIIGAAEWHEFRASGEFRGSTVDLKDGFIHFSYADQLEETARRHFSGQTGLVLLAIAPARLLPALRNEVSRGGELFPHLYGTLSIADVVWDRPVGSDEDGRPVLPSLDSNPDQG
jgi:uncharacterized protein (DUF952 family)